jgi:hypothetical protein
MSVVSSSSTTSTFTKVFTFPANLFDGDYTFEFKCYDAYSHLATAKVYVTLTSNTPQITVNSPVPDSIFGKISTINVQIRIDDLDNDVVPSSVIVRFGGTDFDSGDLIMVAGSGGIYTKSYIPTAAKSTQVVYVLIRCADSQGHVDSAIISININVYYPQLSNPSPLGQKYASNGTIPIGIKITDIDSTTGQIVAKYRIFTTIGSWTYNSGWQSLSWYGFTNWNSTYSSLVLVKNGLYQIEYQAHDENGETGVFNITLTSFFYDHGNMACCRSHLQV